MRRVLHRGRFLSLVDDDGWELATREGATGVVAIVALDGTPETGGHLVLVEQHRPPLGGPVLELPAGLVGDTDPGEPTLAAAQRELLEETGLKAETWTLTAHGPVSAGLTDETVSLWVARGLTVAGPGGGVDGERIVVHRLPLANALDALDALRARGLAVDHKVLTGLWLAGVAPPT